MITWHGSNPSVIHPDRRPPIVVTFDPGDPFNSPLLALRLSIMIALSTPGLWWVHALSEQAGHAAVAQMTPVFAVAICVIVIVGVRGGEWLAERLQR